MPHLDYDKRFINDQISEFTLCFSPIDHQLKKTTEICGKKKTQKFEGKLICFKKEVRNER